MIAPPCERHRANVGNGDTSERVDMETDSNAHVQVAKFRIGEIVRHRIHPFRGVIYDVDPEFSSTDEWWESIPADVRPRKDQPFYHLYAENEQGPYNAYVSEQNLLVDDNPDPVSHPQIPETFAGLENGYYILDPMQSH
jgi:heat shock protein HspQ